MDIDETKQNHNGTVAQSDHCNGNGAVKRDSTSVALADIREERVRQIHVEGWTKDHDDRHFAGEMARAAAAYAVVGSMPDDRNFQADVWGRTTDGQVRTFRIGWFLPALMLWPWDTNWWKPKGQRRNLVKAGALIVAEIERLDRAEAAKADQSQ